MNRSVLDDTSLDISMAHVDIDGVISHLHLILVVVEAVHVVVAVEVLVDDLHVVREAKTGPVVVGCRFQRRFMLKVASILQGPVKGNLHISMNKLLVV